MARLPSTLRSLVPHSRHPQLRRGALRWATGLALSSCVAAPASAQYVSTGGVARNAGLGGGGLAIRDRRASPIINPAALARPVGLRFDLTRGGLTGEGDSSWDAWDILISTGDVEGLADIALDLARRRNQVQGEAGFAVRWSTWMIDLGGTAQAEGRPNAPLRQWVRQGAAFAPPPGAEGLVDVAYMVVPSVGYGHRFSLKGPVKGELEAGARLQFWAGRYLRYRYTAQGGRLNQQIVEDESGVSPGLDLGLRFSPTCDPRFSYAMVVNGLLAPSIGNARQDRAISLGAAMQFNPRLTLVADALNLSGANDRDAKFATGAEYQVIPRWLSVRGAVTTRGLAGGFGIGPFDFAFTRDGQTSLGTQFRF